MSLFTQMAGLTVQNFLSAATGMAVLFALVRGFTRRESDTIGNFWVDLVRVTVHVLVPLSIVLAIVLITQGVVQTFDASTHVTTLEGVDQSLALGPVASQIAVKQLGTNGGGFFGANAAHHVRVHMAELRKKIERDPARPRMLVTEPGVGYRLREPGS